MKIEERIDGIKARFEESGKLSDSERSFISSFYERVTGSVFTKRGCNDCYKDAFIEMYSIYKQKGIKPMGKYILKRGAVIHWDNKAYTRANLTDDIAESILRKYPAQISNFESVETEEDKAAKVNLQSKFDELSKKYDKLEENFNTERDTRILRDQQIAELNAKLSESVETEEDKTAKGKKTK